MLKRNEKQQLMFVEWPVCLLKPEPFGKPISHDFLCSAHTAQVQQHPFKSHLSLSSASFFLSRPSFFISMMVNNYLAFPLDTSVRIQCWKQTEWQPICWRPKYVCSFIASFPEVHLQSIQQYLPLAYLTWCRNRGRFMFQEGMTDREREIKRMRKAAMTLSRAAGVERATPIRSVLTCLLQR